MSATLIQPGSEFKLCWEASAAPGIDLVVLPWHGATAALDDLARGATDLAVSVFPIVDAAFRREESLRERYVVVMRKSHPAARRFGLGRWLSYPHVGVSGRGEARGALDEALGSLDRVRRVENQNRSFEI